MMVASGSGWSGPRTLLVTGKRLFGPALICLAGITIEASYLRDQLGREQPIARNVL